MVGIRIIDIWTNFVVRLLAEFLWIKKTSQNYLEVQVPSLTLFVFVFSEYVEFNFLDFFIFYQSFWQALLIILTEYPHQFLNLDILFKNPFLWIYRSLNRVYLWPKIAFSWNEDILNEWCFYWIPFS